MSHEEAVGLWQLQETQQVPDDGSGRITNDAYTFRYDGDTVTVRLLTLNPGVWKSGDDFYRLEARWNGDTLEYRPPFADWAALAEWRGDHFEDEGGGVRRIFGRIGEDAVADFNRAILDPRQPHDYSIKPTDGPGLEV